MYYESYIANDVCKMLFLNTNTFCALIRLGSRLSGQPCVVYLLATLVTVTADFNNECLCLVD